MNILIIGAGGVGTSAAKIIEQQGKAASWAKKIVVADYDEKRAKKVADKICKGGKFVSAKINARDPESIKAVIEEHKIDFCMNAVEPDFNQCIFDTCYATKTIYLDCAMTLSKPDEGQVGKNKLTYEKLGDYQFDQHEKWRRKGAMAIVGSGVEPGMADVFAKFASKHLFDTIDEVNVRDGDNYSGDDVGYFGFSVWTTMEECLNPPVIWEKKRGWYCTEPFSEPEIFNFPGGIGDVEVANVEHEEVMLVPRVIDCNRVTFKYGVPKETQDMLLYLKDLGLSEAWKTYKVGDSEITPRDFLCKVIPSPVEATMKMKGKGCAGTWVIGTKGGKQRSVYIYQVADNQDCIKKYTTNSVVAQTAVSPVIMMELVAKKIWKMNGVHGPESFDPDPFVERLAKYDFPAGIKEMDSEYADALNEAAFTDAVKGKKKAAKKK